MGGDRPRGRAAERGRRLSLAARWARAIGAHAEPVDVTVAVPHEAALARLSERARPVSSIGRLLGMPPAFPGRTPWRDGLRVEVVRLSFATFRPAAFVRVVPDGRGARVTGEIRPSRPAQAFELVVVTLLALFAAGAVVLLLPALVWERDAVRPLAQIAALYGALLALRVWQGRWRERDRRALREWLASVAR